MSTSVDKLAADSHEEKKICQISDPVEKGERNAEGTVASGEQSGTSTGCREDKADEGSDVFDPLHPLHNHVILTRIFELSPLEDLKKYRLVCKHWYNLSLQTWRSSSVICFRSTSFKRYDVLDFFWEPESPFTVVKPVESINVLGIQVSYLTNIQKFLTYVQIPEHDCERKPFRKFDLFEWSMKEGDEQIDRFRALCGPSITVLQLHECNFASISVFRNALFSWFPNLKKLTVKDFRCDGAVVKPTEPTKWTPPERTPLKHLKYLSIDVNHEHWPVPWFDMFNLYPNMETFKLYNADVEETVEVALKAMKLVRQHDRRRLQIKHLDILAASLYAQDKISPRICLLIRDLQFPLESLTIDLGVDKNSSSTQDILQWHAATLLKLDAYRGPISYPYPDFPFGVQLDALQELVMSDRLSETLAFIKYIPNLKKLTICDAIEDRPPVIPTDLLLKTDRKQLEGFQLEKCTELRFDYALTTSETKILIDCLPNVEKLRIPLNDEQFQMVCQHWKNTLRDLHVMGSIPDDCTITGLSKEDVEEINEAEAAAAKTESGAEQSSKVTLNEDKPAPVVQHPNITDLHELRKFTLCNDDLHPTRILDCSALYGFLKMPQLNSLLICSQMNERARKALYAKIPNCIVHRPRCHPQQPLDWDSNDSDSDWLTNSD